MTTVIDEVRELISSAYRAGWDAAANDGGGREMSDGARRLLGERYADEQLDLTDRETNHAN